MRPLVPTCLLVLLTAAGAQAQGGPPPARVKVDPVVEQDLVQRQLVIGGLRATRRAVLAAEVEGRLAELPFREGDAVPAGAVVARTDQDLLRREVERSAAATAAAAAHVAEEEAGLEKAERDLPRFQQIRRESGGVSQTAVDDAATALAEARAMLDGARADLAAARATEATARQRVDDSSVRAPFTGAVVARHAEVGEWLHAGDEVLELVEIAPIEAWLAVPEEHLLPLSAPGATVEVQVPAVGFVRVLPVGRVVADVDPVSHTFPLVVRLDNEDGTLRPGLRVVARVPTRAHAPTLTVHSDAVLRDDAGARIFVAQGGVARTVRVEPLFLVGNRVAVRAEGLAAGDLAIVEGNERLFPGQPVAPEGPAAAGTTGG